MEFLMTLEEVAAYLRLSKDTVYRLANAAKIPASKVELAKVAPKINEYLTRREVMKRMPEYRAQLEKEAGVKIIGIKEPPKPVEDAAPAALDEKK